MSSRPEISPREAERFRQMGWRADRWAIASESERALEVFAHLASGGDKSFGGVVEAVENGETDDLDLGYLARLGRVVAVRPTNTRLASFALDALRIGAPRMDKILATQATRSLLFELLLTNGAVDEARTFLQQNSDLGHLYHGYMAADLANPRLSASSPGYRAWLDQYNRPFLAEGVAPLAPDPRAEDLFNSLNAMPRPDLFSRTWRDGPTNAELVAQRRLLDDNPQVSVILTTFNPNSEELRTSVESILRQTWPNLELLIVDDHSSELPPGLLEEFQDKDERVRVIRLPVNGGTYLARNAGIRAAGGNYITGQDTDDWSHPQRLERELLALHGNVDASGVMVTANRTDERLVRTAVGFAPQRRCEVSLMLRTKDALGMGGYLPMRKGADSEFRERLIRYAGRSVAELAAPLYMTRLSHGSLSRADFRHGWTAPERLAFSSAYRYWHQREARLLPPLDSAEHSDTPPFSTPERISGRARDGSTRFDVCFLGDWRSFGPLERAAMDEIEALLDGGLAIGVLQLNSPFSDVSSARILQPRLQEWIIQGLVSQVMPDEEIHSRLVIVRDPSVIDYARSAPYGLKAGLVLLVAAGAFGEGDGVQPSYRRDRVASAVERLLDADSRWVRPQGTDDERFRAEFPDSDTADEYPLVVSQRSNRRAKNFHSSSIVIGRDATNEKSQWPSSTEMLSALYPLDGGAHVRILGDARGGVRVLRRKMLPANWIDFRSVSLDAETFWRTVDLAVHFDEEPPGFGPERSLLEALAAGVPVICDERRGRDLGNSAIIVAPVDGPSAVMDLARDPHQLEALSRRGTSHVAENYRPAKFRAYVSYVLAGIAEVEER